MVLVAESLRIRVFRVFPLERPLETLCHVPQLIVQRPGHKLISGGALSDDDSQGRREYSGDRAHSESVFKVSNWETYGRVLSHFSYFPPNLPDDQVQARRLCGRRDELDGLHPDWGEQQQQSWRSCALRESESQFT